MQVNLLTFGKYIWLKKKNLKVTRQVPLYKKIKIEACKSVKKVFLLLAHDYFLFPVLLVVKYS